MDLPLGRQVEYKDTLDPSLLFPIERTHARSKNGVLQPLPFSGVDLWRAFELSWLGPSGVPEVALGTISYPAESPCIVESKSLKLFLNSFNNTEFNSAGEVQSVIASELSRCVGCSVVVEVVLPERWAKEGISSPVGECIDRTPLSGASHDWFVGEEKATEVLYTNLLRSLCPVTGQPDWGTMVVSYSGRKLNPAKLLNSVVEHRNFQGFHEECCEKYFVTLLKYLEPTTLSVGCFYTRRGGIDINPIRWLVGGESNIDYRRLHRQ